ncbi:MAG: type III PLP-dependent enzyme [Elusimicrobiota bacterium]|nr:type III PLP-dependent enzyme [Elusimicrobiota bacterium]
MITKKQMQELARKHGTPLFIVDHDEIRRNYAQFRKYLPRVQAYYAVKAEPLPEIVRTLYKAGASFDVASMPEFLIVHENIKNLPDKERLAWIWDKIIYANPIKPNETLKQLDPYRPLVTYDNLEEVHKIKKYAPHAGLVLRIRVANTGAVVELSSKFGAAPGEAVDLILAAEKAGLGVEGLSFHVGSQTTNFENFVQATNLAADIFKEARERGHTRMNLLDIGGGFPAPYDASVKPFKELATKINAEINRLFPKNIEILAEPGRFMIATAGTSVVKINGKAVRDGKTCYYVDDGAYHTYSGIIFDHQHCHMKSFRKGKEEICGVFGPTCDALDVISMSENLPADLKLGELLYSENMGAYSHASSTNFNGFPPAKVVHINR